METVDVKLEGRPKDLFDQMRVQALQRGVSASKAAIIWFCAVQGLRAMQGDRSSEGDARVQKQSA